MKASKIFDELVNEMAQSFERLPDYRAGENLRYEIKDAAVSAFGISSPSQVPFWGINV